MLENKLVKMVMLFLIDGEKPRYRVSYKIKNYPKDIQAEAIRILMSEGFVSIREEKTDKRGRSPSFIFLTEKGIEKSKGYSTKPDHRSIWGG